MRRALLVLLHFVVGALAVGAGGALQKDPSGASLGFEQQWLEGSPFRDYRVPGIYLSTVIAASNLLSALALALRLRWAGPLSLLTGLDLLAWLAVQFRSVGYRHWSQLLWLAAFLLMTLLALGEARSPRQRQAAQR